MMNLIVQPIIWLMPIIFPFFKKSMKTVRRNNKYQFSIKNEGGGRLRLKFMVLITWVIYLNVVFFICSLFHIHLNDYGSNILFFGMLLLAFVNHCVLERNNNYLKYFTKFDKTSKKWVVYLTAITFTLIVLATVIAIIFVQ